MLLYNARINGRPGAPATEAILIEHGTIAAIGGNAELYERANGAAPRVDVAGRRIVPGLIDGHAHVLRAELTWGREVRWDDAASLTEALELVRRRAADAPPGAWAHVIGGWHPARFREARLPSLEELDQVAPDNPCYVQFLYETAVLNSAGMAACGFSGAVGDPPDGELERDQHGELTGVVRGLGAFQHCLAKIRQQTFPEQVDSIRTLSRDLAKYGLTGAVDTGGIGIGPGVYEPLYEVWRQGNLSTRIRLYLGAGSRGDEREQLKDWMKYLPRGFGDDYLRITGLGEIVQLACWDAEGLEPLEVDADSIHEFTEISRSAVAGGWQMHVHAVTDEAIGMVLDAWETAAQGQSLKASRFMIAHADGASSQNLVRAKALGVGFALQDRLVLRSAATAEKWGKAAAAGAPPLRDMVELGLPLSGGTDATVVSSINPWRSLWWFTTGQNLDGGPRREEAHRLSRAHALDLYTRGSAWSTFDEHRQGQLASGFAADLAVLSDDYYAVPDDEIPDIRSELTLLGGEVVSAAEPFEGLEDDS